MLTFLDFPGLRKRLTLEPRFGTALVALCERLGLIPDYLLSVMSIESAGTFDPSIRNPDGGATGLIQFMPQTAKGLGTTTEDLAKMSAVEQLQYVERFLQGNGGRIRKDVPGDYYMAVFMPAFVGADGTTVLGELGNQEIVPHTNLTYDRIYNSNKGFDPKKTGRFTVADVWGTTLGRIASARSRARLEVPEIGPLVPPAPPPSPSLPPAWRSSGGHYDLPALEVGASGTAVTFLQVLLKSDVITSVYTSFFEDQYVKPFQRAHGLAADGVVGRLTWRALAESCKGPL